MNDDDRADRAPEPRDATGQAQPAARRPARAPARPQRQRAGAPSWRLAHWSRRRGARLAGSRGQSLVELALLLPVWLLLIVGMLDLGRAFHAYMAILNAAREGARYGSIYPGDMPGILSHARREVLPSGISITAVEVACPAGACTPGKPIRVTVRLNFQLISTFVASVRPLPLQASAQFVVM